MVTERRRWEFFHACYKGDFDGIKLGVAYGMGVNDRSKSGLTPLHYASTWGRLDIVTYLIEKGADVNAKCPKGRTALHRAAAWNHVYCVEKLLNARANIDAEDKSQNTALYDPCMFEHEDTIRLLVKRNASIESLPKRFKSICRKYNRPNSDQMVDTQTEYTLMSDITADSSDEAAAQSRPICLREHFTIEKSVGSGGYGIVLRVKHASGKHLAVKQSHEYNERHRSVFNREYVRGRSLNHPNLVKILEFVDDPDDEFLGFTMEFMKSNLKRFMKKNKVSFEVKLHISLQILSGLEYLHEKGWSHDDLKPGNILLSESTEDSKYPIVKLCDFGGLSDRRDVSRSCTANVHTLAYCAPERLQQQRYSTAADVYSFGVVLNELLAGEAPFSDCKGENGLAEFLREHPGVRPSIVRGEPSWIQNVIRQCWSEPSKRPLVQDLKKTFEEELKKYREGMEQKAENGKPGTKRKQSDVPTTLQGQPDKKRRKI